MTDHPAALRSGAHRWPLAALAAALVLYGVAGFPGGGEPDPPSAAAHPLPGFPHLHGGNDPCGGWACPPPGDGTNENPHQGGGGSSGGDGGGGSNPPSNCTGAHADGCEQGVEQGYIDPDDDLGEEFDTPEAIAEMGSVFADHPDNQDVDFDAVVFSNTMNNDAQRPPRRGDVADALCVAISGCSASGDGAIQYLLDNGISFGQTDDTVEGFNANNPVTVGQMGSFLYRLTADDTTSSSGSSNNNSSGSGSGSNGDDDSDEDMCQTGLDLSEDTAALFVSELEWRTLVGIEDQGEPGALWPPHPDVPGGSQYLVVSESPVWPVVDPAAQWHTHSSDGCLWEATTVTTYLSQLVPWIDDDRVLIEDAESARPEAAFDVYLSRWDNLSTGQQTEAQQLHHSRSRDESCPIQDAIVAQDSQQHCWWELPTPGVWSWEAGACFTAETDTDTFQDCPLLASGVEWFRPIADYTQQITVDVDDGADQ